MKKTGVKVGLLVLLLTASASWAAVGPAGLRVQQSDEWGMLASGFYTNQLGEHQALNINTGLGGDRFYFIGTWGWQVLPTQRLKITARHDARRQTFHFADMNPSEWMAQETLGVAYQGQTPILPLLKWQAQAYLGRARDGNFGAAGLSNGASVSRETTGALISGASGHLEAPILFFGHAGAGVYYDRLDYQMANEADPSRQGVGFGIDYSTTFLEFFQGFARAEWRNAFNRFQVGGSWNIIDIPSAKLTVTGKLQRIEPELPMDHEIRYGLNLAYYWGGGDDNISGDAWDFNDWTATPAATIPEVFVIRDQSIQ